MFRRLAAVILSVVLLSPGWLGMTGLTLPFAMIPLLWISASYDQTRRSWWRMFGWAALTAVGLVIVLVAGRQRVGLPIAERVRRSLEDAPADEA